MPKVLWVALPLLLGLLLLAGLAWRGRAPSRRAVNIAASVLLLAYVGTTAGLGIFWVANQQLPVFDWHYLFGYGTLLLLVLHLVFNLPVVWRFLLRRRAAPVAAGTAAARPARRRLVVAWGSGALASVLAFALGWRLGRQASGAPGEPMATAPAPPVESDPGLAAVERFHAATSHRRGLRPAPGIDWGGAPPAFKRLPGAPRVVLPAPGDARAGGPGLAALADLLWHAAGVTETRGGLALRASPSSGALFSTELYLIVVHWAGLEPGVWHHEAQAHALERVAAAPGRPGTSGPAALLVATAVFGRTGRKYGERSYRYLLADLGHLLENLRVVATELQLPLRWLPAFDLAPLQRQLALQPAQEDVLAVMALGAGALEDATLPAPTARPASPAAAGAGPPGLTGEIHAATSRRSPARASAGPPVPASTAGLPLPAVPLQETVWRPVIARRRSIRRFSPLPLPLPALAAVLRRMVATGPQLSAAVRIDLLAQAVDPLVTGAYRYDPRRQVLLRRRTPLTRAASRAAALEQDVVGDAAAVCVLSIDRAAFAADPLGPARGYRHAFLEAGLVGERAYLEAALQGLGVCAVGAFHDDEAAALVGLDTAREWPVHFIAIGLPA